jgi:thioesterase domain-containing protein
LILASTAGTVTPQPEPYDGPVGVAERDERFAYTPSMGWENYLTGDVTVHTVPGGHLTAYEEPHVSRLGGHLAVELASHRVAGRAAAKRSLATVTQDVHR